jgi:L-histidine N-alpha-methyltransferase
MAQPVLRERFELVTAESRETTSFAEDVAKGLDTTPKRLPSHWFYDAAGSALFEEICDLPEYYLTRCEHSILDERADEIAARFNGSTRLIELGSGSATKTRLLIDAFLARTGRLTFAPIDISKSMLEQSATRLLEDYPQLEVLAFAGLYELGLDHLAARPWPERLILWLGSSVGNLDRADAAKFLFSVREHMVDADRLLIGIDLRKDPGTLERAYDDSQGVTARFDLNLLARINRELGGQFDLEQFRHRATWREEPGRVESHLVSLSRQDVRIDALDTQFTFEDGETIHTENSHKYSPSEIDELAAAAGMRCEEYWLDANHMYRLNMFAPA